MQMMTFAYDFLSIIIKCAFSKYKIISIGIKSNAYVWLERQQLFAIRLHDTIGLTKFNARNCQWNLLYRLPGLISNSNVFAFELDVNHFS